MLESRIYYSQTDRHDSNRYLKEFLGRGNARGPVRIHTRLANFAPISNEDRTVWTVYNGEIFNFPELRRELEERGHRFSTRSDTEVIVHLYEERGEDFVSRLNGMFAIALWDTRERKLRNCLS